MAKHRALRRGPRHLPAGARRTRHDHRGRRHHAVVRHAQRRRVGQHRPLPQRNPREVVMLQVQQSGGAAPHALYVRLRNLTRKTVIVQK